MAVWNKISRHLWGLARRRTGAQFCRTAFYRQTRGIQTSRVAQIRGHALPVCQRRRLVATQLWKQWPFTTGYSWRRPSLFQFDPSAALLSAPSLCFQPGEKTSCWHLTYRTHVCVQIFTSIHAEWKELCLLTCVLCTPGFGDSAFHPCSSVGLDGDCQTLPGLCRDGWDSMYCWELMLQPNLSVFVNFAPLILLLLTNCLSPSCWKNTPI